jgi:Uncharacterized conserved protein
MALKEKISKTIRDALKRQEMTQVATLRLLLSDIKNAEIAQQKPLDDSKVLDIVAKEVRQHRESIEAFNQGKRSDLVVREEAELKILMEYLPEQMSQEEIVAAARQVIDAVGAKGPGDKGRVMSQLIPQLKGKADGREVSDVVVQLLAGM